MMRGVGLAEGKLIVWDESQAAPEAYQRATAFEAEENKAEMGTDLDTGSSEQSESEDDSASSSSIDATTGGGYVDEVSGIEPPTSRHTRYR